MSKSTTNNRYVSLLLAAFAVVTLGVACANAAVAGKEAASTANNWTAGGGG